MKYPVAVTVNGRLYRSEVEARELLVHFLRNELGLTGTHVGCDTSQCGSCAVLCDGLVLKSCTRLAVQADGAAITTIEGLSAQPAADGPLQRLMEALAEGGVFQCGFCAPGVLFAAQEILEMSPAASEAEVRQALDGVLCRCGAYQKIVEAICGCLAVPAAVPAGGNENA